MKKLFLAFILCFTMLLFSHVYTSADSKIVESPDIKIIINGNSGLYEDVPINLNGRTMLPLRAVLKDLGVPDDDDHIVWNGSERSVTIHKDSTTIFLKVDSISTTVNNQSMNMDVPPVIYKNKTYIPARFVAQSLGLKVAWDGYSKAVFIRDQASFNQAKEILQKSVASMTALSKYKTSNAVDFSFFSGHDSFFNKFNSSKQIDQKNQRALSITNLTMTIGGLDANSTSRWWYTKDYLYYKQSQIHEWEKHSMADDIRNQIFNAYSYLTPNDLLCSAMDVYDANSTETVLKGNFCIKALLDQNMSADVPIEYGINEAYTEVHMDKTRNLVTKVIFTLNGLEIFNGIQGNFVMSSTYTNSDFNGNFEVNAPSDLPK